MKIVYKSYNLCTTDTTISERLDAFTNSPRTLLGQWTPTGYVTAPLWFGWVTIFGANIYTFNPTTLTNGATVIGFLADGIEYLIIINIGTSCGFNSFTFEPECCTGTNIVWLNQQGGYQNFLFSGKRSIFEVGEGEVERFKTQNMTLKNASIRNLYRSVIVNTGVIDVELLPILESLRCSIQAWVYDEELPEYLNYEDRLTPIIIDRDAMIVRDTKERIVERSIRFLIAKEKIIQGQ